MSDYHGMTSPAGPGSCMTAWGPLYTKEMETTSPRGLYLDMPAWGYHGFDVEPTYRLSHTLKFTSD